MLTFDDLREIGLRMWTRFRANRIERRLRADLETGNDELVSELTTLVFEQRAGLVYEDPAMLAKVRATKRQRVNDAGKGN